ncbi:slit homolog 2 protein-like [Seriola lalandi dorsalis]|uniref:slit homolog 2 protein-like n=1 Tax=Seriola lalandi dorsalis TaxID=1841481 RepID=UPI000C6F4CBE|nr:slit homolog 2 protein-like [Seriola lalandi dorsalis]
MALWWCAKIFCRLAAAWFPLLFSSLLWQTIFPVYAAPSCPRTCSCPGVKEVHCTFRHLTTIPKTFPRDTERLNLGYNSLTEVEGSEFRSLRQLEMLMLHGNDINTVHPGAFYSLRSLQVLDHTLCPPIEPGLSPTPGLKAQSSPTDQKSQLKLSSPHLRLLEQQETPYSLIPTCHIKIITWVAGPKPEISCFYQG